MSGGAAGSSDQRAPAPERRPSSGPTVADPSTAGRQHATRRGDALLLIALVAGAAVVSFYDLSGGAGFDPPDAWVAQTAREMSAARDWQGYIVPRFSGEVRLQKSPGPYWAVIATARLTGRPIDEFTARVPSAILAVGLVVVIYWLARNIADRRSALIGGFAAASSLMLLYWSHRAAADLGVTTFIALSLSALWIGSERYPMGPQRVILWMLGYFAAGLAMLYKMPMPLVCVGLPALLYVLICRRWTIFRSPWHALGVVLFLLPWLPWLLATLYSEPTAWDKWRVEFLDRFTGDSPNVEEQKTDVKLYLLYLGVVAVFAAPFTLSIPGALIRAVRGHGYAASENAPPDIAARRGRWFLLIWFISVLAFFTAAAGKETRYIVPALPPLFVLLGVELAAFFHPRRHAAPWLDRAGAIVATIAAPAAALAIVSYLRGISRRGAEFGIYPWADLWLPVMVMAATLVCGVIATAWLRALRREHWAFGALCATMWAAWLWAWPTLMPIYSGQTAFKDFAAQLSALPAEARARLHQVAQQDPRIIWYSDVRFPRVVDQLDLLRQQRGRRELEREIEIVGRAIVDRLESDELNLFVAAPGDYALFQALTPVRLADHGREMPANHVWLVARVGRPDQRYILFGNRRPPWPEPELHPRLIESIDRLRQKAESAAR